MIINIPQKEIRQKLYTCIDIEKLREALMHSRNDFIDIKTILPVGILGAKSGKVDQRCSNKDPIDDRFTFLNWRTDSIPYLLQYLESLKEVGLNFTIAPYTLDEFVKIALVSPHPYDLAVVALDAVRPDYSAFYEYLVGDGPRLIDLELPEARNIYCEMLSKATIVEQRPYAERLNRILEEEAVVLPLFQEKRTFYYPRRVADLDLGGNFLEYPDIASLKIRSGLAMMIDEAIFRIGRQIDGWFGRSGVEEAP